MRSAVAQILFSGSLLDDLEESRRQSAESVAEVLRLRAELQKTKDIQEQGELARRVSSESKTIQAMDWFERGQAAMLRGQFRDAVKYYTVAIELVPGWASIYNNRSHAYLELREWKAGLADANMAISLILSRADAYVNRSWAKLSLSDYRRN